MIAVDPGPHLLTCRSGTPRIEKDPVLAIIKRLWPLVCAGPRHSLQILTVGLLERLASCTGMEAIVGKRVPFSNS